MITLHTLPRYALFFTFLNFIFNPQRKANAYSHGLNTPTYSSVSD
jgi:hypothetical protein